MFRHRPRLVPIGIDSVSPKFRFDRLGVRVPAVLVSPYIQAETVITDTFDHALAAATARKVFLGAGWQDTFLTQRDKVANTFEGALTLATPRSPKEVDPTKFHQAQLAAHPMSIEERARIQAAQPLSDHQIALTAVMASAAAQRMTQGQAAKLTRRSSQVDSAWRCGAGGRPAVGRRNQNSCAKKAVAGFSSWPSLCRWRTRVTGSRKKMS